MMHATKAFGENCCRYWLRSPYFVRHAKARWLSSPLLSPIGLPAILQTGFQDLESSRIREEGSDDNIEGLSMSSEFQKD